MSNLPASPPTAPSNNKNTSSSSLWIGIVVIVVGIVLWVVLTMGMTSSRTSTTIELDNWLQSNSNKATLKEELNNLDRLSTNVLAREQLLARMKLLIQGSSDPLVRLVFVQSEGKVLVDSDQTTISQVDALSNHNTRAEIIQAWASHSGSGTASRYSSTVQALQQYKAWRLISSNGKHQAVVRLSKTVLAVD